MRAYIEDGVLTLKYEDSTEKYALRCWGNSSKVTIASESGQTSNTYIPVNKIAIVDGIVVITL